MELRQLETFRVLASELNFTRAAGALNYAQSSVTGQIQALEQELGARLFDRLGKRVVLTDNGRLLLTYAHKILALAAEAGSALQGGEQPGGTLVIAAPETLCTYRLPPVLQRLRARYPQVQLTFRSAGLAECKRALREGAVDAAFVIAEEFAATDLHAKPLLSEPLLLVAHPEHSLAQAHQVAPVDLEGVPLLLTEAACSYRMLLERILAEQGVSPDARMEFASVEAIKQCAQAGMGVGFLPAVTVGHELRKGRLAALRWAGPPLVTTAFAIWHRDKHLTPALRALLDLAGELLKAAA